MDIGCRLCLLFAIFCKVAIFMADFAFERELFVVQWIDYGCLSWVYNVLIYLIYLELMLFIKLFYFIRVNVIY
jgi:hypothetical protein